MIRLFSILAVGFSLIVAGQSARAKQEMIDARYAIQSGMVVSILSKEICSCHFVEDVSLRECLQRSNLPEDLLKRLEARVQIGAKVLERVVFDAGATKILRLTVRKDTGTVRVGPTFIGALPPLLGSPFAKALYNRAKPQLGCVSIVEPNQSEADSVP